MNVEKLRVGTRGGKTVENEVEAKLFSAKMNCEISEGNNNNWFQNLNGLAESPYGGLMFNLFYGGYDEITFKGAVKNFFSGALSGYIYRDTLRYTYDKNNHQSLIMKFLPVKK